MEQKSLKLRSLWFQIPSGHLRETTASQPMGHHSPMSENIPLVLQGQYCGGRDESANYIECKEVKCGTRHRRRGISLSLGGATWGLLTSSLSSLVHLLHGTSCESFWYIPIMATIRARTSIQ